MFGCVCSSSRHQQCGIHGDITPARRIAVQRLQELTEKDWQQQLVGTKGNPGVARTLGWRCYHTLRSRGSEPGYPDWTLVRERVVFLELKTEAGKVSPAQKVWLSALMNAGAEVYIARPFDLDQIGRVLAHRGDPFYGRQEIADDAAALRQETRRQTSIGERRARQRLASGGTED